MKNGKLQYGIISSASIVPRFVKGLQLTEKGEAAVISSRDQQKAEKLAAELNIPEAVSDCRSIFNDPKIDVVYLPLINSLHYPYGKEALLAGKHVIMEKPFVLHAAEARELAELAEQKHLFITEAVKTPYLPLYAKIRDLIAGGTLGNIRFMEFRQSYTSGPYISGWNRRKESGGGVLYGNEAYFFTMAEYLCGEVVSCSASLTYPGDEAEDQCAVTAVMKNGACAVLAVSTRVLFENGLTIYFDHGKIVIPDYWKASRACITRENKETEEIFCPFTFEFQYELNHYNECILNGLSFSPVTTMEKTIRHTEIIEKLYQDQPYHR